MNKIQKYFQYRQNLIDQYLKGDLSKSEYLELNYLAVINNEIKPFKNIDTLEKGLFNYHYYNAMAKRMKVISTFNNDYTEEINYYYKKKDTATFKVLKILDYQNVFAYYVKVQSKILRGKLIEIIIEEYKMILHTTNEAIVKCLKEEQVFIDDIRLSLIDGYINQKY